MESKKLLSKEAWASCVLLLRANYPNSFVGDTLGINAMGKMLRDLDEAKILKAVEICVKTKKFAPCVAEIREEVAKLDDDTSWSDAWSEALEKCSYFISPVFNAKTGKCDFPEVSELTEKTVKNFGGWEILAKMRVQDLNISRSHFRDVFKNVKAKIDRQKQLGLKSVQSAKRQVSIEGKTRVNKMLQKLNIQI